MHNWAKQIMECVKVKIDGMGIDNVEGQHLEELKSWVCIAKDIAEYDYYYHITEAMEKPEEEYGQTYDENGRYYTRARDSRGRFMKRRGYEMPMDTMNNRMTPEEYRTMTAERMRDMDRMDGTMYYTETDKPVEPIVENGNYSNVTSIANRRATMGMGFDNGMNSRYDNARRGYEESKVLNPNDDPQNMKAIEKLFSVLEEDLKELKPQMTNAEKSLSKSRLANMSNML